MGAARPSGAGVRKSRGSGNGQPPTGSARLDEADSTARPSWAGRPRAWPFAQPVAEGGSARVDGAEHPRGAAFVSRAPAKELFRKPFVGARRHVVCGTMKRLTIGADACTETLALLITMAWADGRLDEQEREGVRAAAAVLNLTKELRERLDQLLETPLPVDELLFDELSERDKAFAYVAAAWMSGLDAEVAPEEEALLGKLAAGLGFSEDRRHELELIARDLEPLRAEGSSWATELVSLFQAIPSRIDGESIA